MPIEVRELVIKINVNSSTNREIRIVFRNHLGNAQLGSGEMGFQSVQELTGMLNRWGIGRGYSGNFVIESAAQDAPGVERLVRGLQASGFSRAQILLRSQQFHHGQHNYSSESDVPTIKLPVLSGSAQVRRGPATLRQFG